MAENKKNDSGTVKPSQGKLFLGAALLVVGLSWSVWEGFLRPPTDAEIEEKRKEERANKLKEAEARRKQRR